MKREDEPKITYSKSICYKIPTLALSRSGTESKKILGYHLSLFKQAPHSAAKLEL